MSKKNEKVDENIDESVEILRNGVTKSLQNIRKLPNSSSEVLLVVPTGTSITYGHVEYDTDGFSWGLIYSMSIDGIVTVVDEPMFVMTNILEESYE